MAVRNSLLFALATMFLSLVLGAISALILLARPRGPVDTRAGPALSLATGHFGGDLGLWLYCGHGQLAHVAAVNADRPHLDCHALCGAHLSAGIAQCRSPVAGGCGSALTGPRLVEVDAPILLRALLVSATFAFTISLGELGATLSI